MATTVTAHPIFSVKQTDPSKNKTIEAKFGVYSDNVVITNTSSNPIGTLTDFGQDWIDFKNNSQFIYYGTTTPSSSSVKVWYDTTTVTVTAN